MEELTTLAADLATIPRHEGEREAGDFIESWLRTETDADVTRDDGLLDTGDGEPPGGGGRDDVDRGGNVIARKGSGASLALVGHHDVVPPDASQVDGEEYVIEWRDGRLRGRGTADMTGAVAAAMLAFRDADPAGELVFVSFVGEESGCLGSAAAIDRGFDPDYAVVGEGSTDYATPGVTDVVIAHNGRRGGTITAQGAAAHASEPETGANAIYRAADAVEVVRDIDPPATTVRGHDVSGSVAVTEIEGGSAWNVIPESCAVTVDERTVPGARLPIERVEAIDGISWRIDQDLPPMRCSDGAFADAVLDAAGTCQEGVPEEVTKPAATDAGRLAETGTACVVCGPAEPGEAHTATESVSIDALARCYRIYRNVAETWPR
ncbi:MAG: M20 family metallopeptidase [Halobacteriales archaeon]